MESELFSEIYNCYFLVVRRILDEAAEHGLSESDLNRIADTYGYEESALAIVPKLVSGEWNLLVKSPEGPSGKPLFYSRVKAPEPVQEAGSCVKKCPAVVLSGGLFLF